jgi:hypothetical protein
VTRPGRIASSSSAAIIAKRSAWTNWLLPPCPGGLGGRGPRHAARARQAAVGVLPNARLVEIPDSYASSRWTQSTALARALTRVPQRHGAATAAGTR